MPSKLYYIVWTLYGVSDPSDFVWLLFFPRSMHGRHLNWIELNWIELNWIELKGILIPHVPVSILFLAEIVCRYWLFADWLFFSNSFVFYNIWQKKSRYYRSPFFFFPGHDRRSQITKVFWKTVCKFACPNRVQVFFGGACPPLLREKACERESLNSCRPNIEVLGNNNTGNMLALSRPKTIFPGGPDSRFPPPNSRISRGTHPFFRIPKWISGPS